MADMTQGGCRSSMQIDCIRHAFRHEPQVEIKNRKQFISNQPSRKGMPTDSTLPSHSFPVKQIHTHVDGTKSVEELIECPVESFVGSLFAVARMCQRQLCHRAQLKDTRKASAPFVMAALFFFSPVKITSPTPRSCCVRAPP